MNAPSNLPESASVQVMRDLLDASDHLLFRVDLVRRGFDYISPKAELIYGVGLDVLYARGLDYLLTELMDPEDVADFRQKITELCRASPGQKIKTNVEYRLRNVQGATVWHRNSMTLESGPDGRPLSATGVTIDATARRQFETALRESESKYRATMDAVHVGVYMVQNQRFLFVNPKLCEMFGYCMDDFSGRVQPIDLIIPEQHVMLIDRMNRRAAGEHVDPYELIGVHKDGTRFPLMIMGEMILLEGRPTSVGTVIDLTAQRQSEQTVRLASRVFESSQEAILLTDAQCNIVSVNTAFLEMTGYSAEEVIGKNPRLLNSGRQPPEFYVAMWQSIDFNDRWQGEIWNRNKAGEVFPVWLRINVYRDASGTIHNYVGIAVDISERLETRERIRQLAYFDPLTHLPNRRLLQDRVVQALSSAEREGNQLGLLFIDLDQFKKINDSLGHSAGDRLLSEVARRILACVRRADTVARLGGDEFVVLLQKASAEGCAEVSRKILDAVSRPFLFDQHELGVTPSLGISLYPQDGGDFETLLKHADTAMYHAKEAGRNTYQFFADEMNAAALERLVLENSLRRGLERGEFVLHYQPLISVADGRIVGAEALVRWLHPEQGLISPARFIPVAEQSGLIVPIGEWVLREACRQNQAWQNAGLPGISMAVNISSVQFHGSKNQSFVQYVQSVIDQSGLAAEFLELELTEGILMGHGPETVDTLDRLSEIGVKLAIDDFGTGYSSLSYLRRFPIDKLKIDQSFIRDIASSPDDWAIVCAIISMGHSLRLAVIAEGVEQASQREMLTEQGCDEVQGYHFSRPLPAEQFAELLRRQPFLMEV